MKAKELKLVELLNGMSKVLIAFSGGVDSTYLATLANKVLGDHAFIITLKTEYIPERELDEAVSLAKSIGLNHRIIELSALTNQNISSNPPDRCFFCKTDLFSHLIGIAKELGIDYILDGSNIDDMKEYRPGIRALNNLKIISPLKEVGLTKEEIRILSRNLGLPTWDKASFSCLATRIPYHDQLTIEKIKQVEKAEDYLYSKEFKQFRVRHHDDIARIEILPKDFDRLIAMHTEVNDVFRSIGFKYVALDLNGYRTGSLNDLLKRTE